MPGGVYQRKYDAAGPMYRGKYDAPEGTDHGKDGAAEAPGDSGARHPQRAEAAEHRHHARRHHHHHHHHHHQAKIFLLRVPDDMRQHSYGELFQELIAPPLSLVALGLYRHAGTKHSVEPYVYTAPRADTVLHEGDRIYVLGEPPK